MIADLVTSVRVLLAATAVAVLLWTRPGVVAQSDHAAATRPRVELVSAPLLRLSGEVDSNSPVVWDRVGGRNLLFVTTSFAGQPSTATGRELRLLGRPTPVSVEPWPGGGIWIEAIVADVDGSWYGYYHNEVPAQACRTEQKVIPRIGAMRSDDRGLTWQPLGVILEAPPRTYECASPNRYFVGGVGDFSVQLDPESENLYFFYSEYLRSESLQGVAVARLAWADRDNPGGKIMVWRTHTWLPANEVMFGHGAQRWIYPPAVPIFPAVDSFHDEDRLVDAYWGPSVHWNTHLEQYVMLLNHAKDDSFGQEGIYVSFAPTLDDPRAWTAPVKILNGGRWYPQVIGLDEGRGTDKIAAEWARFFMQGTSQHLIHFIR
jgi:hypothetical protein